MSGRRGLNLSAAQVIAGVLATLSAAVAASFLGVAGTLLGAALGSVFSTMGTEIYKHYLQRSEERLRTAGQVLYHSAAKTKTGDTQAGNTQAQAGAASGGRHAAYQGSAGQQGATRQLGNPDVAGQDPASQETAVWDRRQYGTPRDPHQTETLTGSGTQWRGAAYGGVTNGGSPNGGAANGGSSNGWNGSADSAWPAREREHHPGRGGRRRRGPWQRVVRDHQLLQQPDPSAVADLWWHRRGIVRHRHRGHRHLPARRGQAAAEQPGRPHRAAAAAEHAPVQHAVGHAERVHVAQPDVLGVAELRDADAGLGDADSEFFRRGVLTLDRAVAHPEHGQQRRGQEPRTQIPTP